MKHFVFFLFAFVLASTVMPAISQESPSDVERLAARIAKLSYWRNDRAFSPEEWKLYIEVAQDLQTSKHETRVAALQKFYSNAIKSGFDGIGDDLSKPFILLRISFQYPDDKPAIRGAWIGPTKTKDRSMLWPLSIKANGQVELLALYRGSATRYLPQKDYEDVSSLKIPNRDLSKLTIGSK